MAKAKLPVRERIVRAAADLLAKGGREAVSTRAVSAAAGVQAPAIYRQFGDMRGLLDAAARETLAAYVKQKSKREVTNDPVEDLRRAWDEHQAFGLANGDAYAILYRGDGGEVAPVAQRDGIAILEALLTRIAEAGRLRVSVESATTLIQAGGSGVVFTLLAVPPAERDPHLNASMREAVIAAIAEAPTKAPRTTKRIAPRAIALRAVLPETKAISAGERQLLGEWLDRLASADD